MHLRSPSDMADIRRRLIRVWNDGDLDLRPDDLSRRFGVGINWVRRTIQAALESGETTRAIKQPPTPGMRNGRPTGGIGRAHDLGWDRCGGTGGGR